MKKRVLATLAADTVDADARTVDCVFYTGAVVARGGFWVDPYDLVMDFAGVDLEELNGGTAPVLNAHGRYRLEDVLGHVVEGSAVAELGETIEAAEGISYVTGEARAKLRYISSPDIEPIWQRIAQGAARNVSMGVGFDVKDTVTVGAKQRLDGGTVDLVIARKWRPYEISPVPLGADPRARTLAAEDEPDPIADRIRADLARQDLARQGAQTMPPTTAPAPEPTPTPTPAPAPDTAKLQREAEAAGAAAAFERLAMARQVASVTGYPVDKAEALAQDVKLTDDQIRKTMLEYAASKQAPVGGEMRVEHVSEGSERHALAVEGALYLKLSGGDYDPHTYTEMKWVGRGRNRRKVEDQAETARMRKVLSAGRDLVGVSTTDLVRRHLEVKGLRVAGLSTEDIFAVGFKDSRMVSLELQQRMGATLSMSSSDFPKILQNIATKRLMAAYMDAPVFYEQLAWRWDVPDFKTFSLPQRGDVPTPELVKEGGEYKRMVIGERGESGRATKKGLIIPFTWEAMINDDLSAFDIRPMEISEAFRDEEQQQWIDLVEDNTTTLADGGVTYDAAYNTLAGTSGDPDIDTATSVQTALAKQRGINGNTGRPRNLDLYAVLGPPELRRGLEVTFGPVVNVPDSLSNTRQPSLGLPLTRIFTDARLSSTSAWYAFADPMRAPIVAYGYLTGQPDLSTETRNGWDVDGLEIKARRVMHFTKVGRVGAVKNAG